MIIILNISSEKFSFNGIPYFKNFMSHVVAGKLKIVNVYDASFELAVLDSHLNYSVDGVVYPNVAALQNALLPVIYTRNSLNFSSDLPFYNQITKENGIVSVGLNKTFNAGWEWLINNVKYSNTEDQTLIFPLASVGKQRLDRVVVTNLNTFIRIPGIESISSPSAEARPDNTVDVTFVLVTDSEVEDPAPPVTGDLYVKKSESQNVMLTGSGVINILQITDERTSIVFAGTITRLNTIKYLYEMYNGKIVTLYNRQAIDVTIPHASPGGSVDFNFPDGNDYVLKPGQVITFFFDMSYYPYSHHMFIGESGKEDKSNKNQPNGYPGLDSSGKISSNQLPSYVDDVLEGYLLSNVFYTDAAHTIVIPAESGKVYVDISTGQKNKQYRYSGSTYIQITNGLIASTDDVVEGALNKYSTLSLVMSYVLTGISFASGTAITAADNILSALGKLQKQITDNGAAITLKQVKDDQVEINSSMNVQNSWHGQTVLFTANCTITVPASLNNSLMFPFRTLSGVTVTWAITSPFVWETTPLVTPEKTVGHFMRRGSANTIILDV